VKLQLVACVSLWSALAVAAPIAALAQSAASAPAVPASGAAGLPVLAKDPEQGHLRPGQQVLVDDGSCPAGQIKELTGGTNRKCEVDAGVLDTSRCHPVTGAHRTSRCVARP
jgi:hypothetical protein